MLRTILAPFHGLTGDWGLAVVALGVAVWLAGQGVFRLSRRVPRRPEGCALFVTWSALVVGPPFAVLYAFLADPRWESAHTLLFASPLAEPDRLVATPGAWRDAVGWLPARLNLLPLVQLAIFLQGLGSLLWHPLRYRFPWSVAVSFLPMQLFGLALVLLFYGGPSGFWLYWCAIAVCVRLEIAARYLKDPRAARRRSRERSAEVRELVAPPADGD